MNCRVDIPPVGVMYFSNKFHMKREYAARCCPSGGNEPMNIANNAKPMAQYLLIKVFNGRHVSRASKVGVIGWVCRDDKTSDISARRAPEKKRKGLTNSPVLKK